jgi:prophage tail gpP-like protein
MTTHPDIPILTINGRAYSGWETLRVSRGIDRCVSDFKITVSERWTGQATPWQILPFAACQVAIDGTPVLTGYVDEYNPKIGPKEHAVEIAGRSKTQDLVDCTPDVPSGQYSGYSLAQIARSVAALFGIGTVVLTDLANETFADAQIERSETAFTFLERLGRLSGVLLSDDELGRLVLTTAGSTRATGTLVQGQNMQSATAKLSASKRFSDYIVKGQHSIGTGGSSSWGGAGGIGSETAAVPAGTVQTQMEAVAHDSTVPRYRPRVVLAESQLTAAGMQLRANWLRQAAYGNATKAEITVAGWRQPDGTLWTVNTLVPVTSPSLGVDQDLLIARVEFELSARAGRTTKLHVGPVEGFTPDPGEVKIHKKKGNGKGANCPTWTGAGGA